MGAVTRADDASMAPTPPGCPPADASRRAEALIRDHGAEAYREARQRQQDVVQIRQDSLRPDAGALATGRAHRGPDDGQASRPRHGDADARAGRRMRLSAVGAT